MPNITGKLSLSKFKEMSKDDWQEFLLSNIETIFIVAQIILLLVLFRFRMVERSTVYRVPDIRPDPSVEQVFPNPAYTAIVEAPDFDFLASPLAILGSKNVFDFKYVKDPQMLEEEILHLESRARALFEQEDYREALRTVEGVLLRNPYREASLELKRQIEEKLGN